MKKLTLLFCAFLFCVHMSQAQTDAELGVLSIGLVVSDLEASERFYKEIIGMEEVRQFSLDEKWADDAGASNGKPFSVKMLKQKNLPSATILKLAYFDQMDKKPDMSGVDVNAGVNYLTFSYGADDFEAVVKRIEAAGIEKMGWVSRDRYRLFFIKDPDGVFVELFGPPEK
ncbi:MAG: VOC family protein [Cytophagales bacterium]|nr:VOC family protein [Cytophagales bacterium]